MSKNNPVNPIFDVDNPKSFPLPPTKLIPGIIYQRVLTSIWGAPGSGKSHLALDLACMIAQKYPVVYVAAEAPYEVGIRAMAWKKFNNTSCFNNLAIWMEPIFLMNELRIDGFISAISTMNPIAVFIDPLAQCFVGGNENETQDMSTAVYNLNRIARKLNSAICVVAHTGWEGRHERGNSALRAANRISISVKMDTDKRIVIHTVKQNVGKPMDDRYFLIKQIGDKEDETVIVPTLKEVQQNGEELSDRQQQVLASLNMSIFSDGVTKAELAKYTETTYGMSLSGTYKAVNSLVDKELCYSLKGGKVGITSGGKEIISILHYKENSKQNSPYNKFNWTLYDSPTFSINSPLFSTDSPTILQDVSTQDSPILHPLPPYKGGSGETGEKAIKEKEESDKDVIH